MFIPDSRVPKSNYPIRIENPFFYLHQPYIFWFFVLNSWLVANGNGNHQSNCAFQRYVSRRSKFESVAIFHVTFSVKRTNCNSNGFSYDISRTIRSRIKNLITYLGHILCIMYSIVMWIWLLETESPK